MAHSDGTFSFIAEKAYLGGSDDSLISPSGLPTDKSAAVKHTDELIIPRFTEEGELINMELVEKEFDSVIDKLTSYSYFEKEDRIYILFNDNKKWGEKKDLKKGKNKAKTKFTDICIINSEGEIEKRETLFTSGEIECFYTPKLSFYAEDKLIIRADKTKKYRYGIFDLK
jgi:hypothetical protein